MLTLAGAAPVAWPAEHVIGVDGFYVEIARACSGVEGLALVLGFATIYAAAVPRRAAGRPLLAAWSSRSAWR